MIGCYCKENHRIAKRIILDLNKKLHTKNSYMMKKLKECDNVGEIEWREIERREVTYAIEVVPLQWSATKQEEKEWIK